MTLSDDDREVVDSARAELRDTPLPPAMGALGCLAALGGVLAIGLWPGVLRVVPAASFFSPFVMLGAVLAIIAGPVFALFGGQSGRNHARAAIEAALRTLEDDTAPREAHLRASAVLLSRAYISQGPSTEQILEPGPARERVGPRIALVLAVERDLVARFNTLPVFGSDSVTE